MNFNELPEFKKECKRFAKKYKSLFDDLQEFRNVISIIPLGNSKHFNIVTQTENVKIIFLCHIVLGTPYGEQSEISGIRIDKRDSSLRNASFRMTIHSFVIDSQLRISQR